MVGRKNEFGEFPVRCYKEGRRYPDGDAFPTTLIEAEQIADSVNNEPINRLDKETAEAMRTLEILIKTINKIDTRQTISLDKAQQIIWNTSQFVKAKLTKEGG